MAEIIKIQYSEKRITVDLDSGERYILPPEAAGKFGLEKGMVLAPERLEGLLRESQTFQCWQKSLRYLAIRGRSIKEMKQYLKRKDFPAEVVNNVVTRLMDYRYLNDHDFALRYTENRLRQGKRGINLVKRELTLKGVSHETIQQAIDECGVDPGGEELFRLAEKKLKSLQGKENVFYRLSSYLYQRGFTREQIRDVLKRLKCNFDGEDC